MSFQFISFAPPAGLRPVLRGSFFARGRISYRFDKILPNGLVVAVFNYGAPHRIGKSEKAETNPEYAHSWLHGVQTTPIYNMPGGETHVLGLLFEPIGFHALFGIDMRTLVDRTVDSRQILPSTLIDSLARARPMADRQTAHATIHEALLSLSRTVLPAWLSALYDEIPAQAGEIRLTESYAAIGRSARHVNVRFRLAVGVSPKTLCRIYRLQALLAAIDPAAPAPWTTLAHEFGFYDQPHFNREFRKFSGLHPSRYLAQRQRDLPALGQGESVHFAPQR